MGELGEKFFHLFFLFFETTHAARVFKDVFKLKPPKVVLRHSTKLFFRCQAL